MTKRLRVLPLVFLLLYGCGSGTFENDPETWNKVFGEDQPSEIEVLNSKFWKSGHWTYEFELHMAIKAPQQFIDTYFIERYNLIEVKNVNLGNGNPNAPDWYLPERENITKFKHRLKQIYLYQDKNSNITYLHIIQV